MKKGSLALSAALLATPLQSLSAQAEVAPILAEVPAPCCAIPALTVIEIEIVPAVNSQANHIGEHFAIRLAKPIVVDGKVLVPAGATGSGDVVHAAKSRFGGKPGELILAVRYIEYQGVRIPLRSLHYGTGQGQDNSGTAAALSIAGGAIGGIAAMFVTGGEVNIPAGTSANAKVAVATTIPEPQPSSTGATGK